MTTFRRGDVVLVPFELTDRPVRKSRTAIILSTNRYNRDRQDVIIAAVTSRIRRPLLYGDRLIQRWQQSGLLKPSVMTATVRTVRGGTISRRLGKLTKDDMKAVDVGLTQALDLRPAQG